MNRDISKANQIPLHGIWKRTIVRADGSKEIAVLDNIVTANGLNAIAARAISNTTTPFDHLAVGTLTSAASLGSTNFGEVDRKVPVTVASSKEVFYAVCTWQGAADGVTSVPLDSAAIVNHVDSGQGTVVNIVTGLSATLADSDYLHLEVQIQCGSHNL